MKTIKVSEDVPQITGAGKTPRPDFLEVGAAPGKRRIAFLKRQAAATSAKPGIVWLGGFKSDMVATKATALDEWAATKGRDFLRFDYSGHGFSDGRFEDASICDWLEESLAILSAETSGPQILVGSSMGGWIALLLMRTLAQLGQQDRIAGLVLIAPAVDFTEKLIFERLPQEAREALQQKGVWYRSSPYSPEPYPITRKLIEEGRQHLLFNSVIRTYCPVHILQGLKDTDVPPEHVMALLEHLAGESVVLTSIKDGDHRLSRPQDIALLISAIENIA